ncbi:MAG: segregation/condensation protein A [Nitrospirae bacterium]|nr:segregation/condensation protein A [Nitrospirota bacterium]
MSDETESPAAYEVKLPVFEGPLDLLLHLIREHRIDIYDIPITLITQQYLDYLELMTELNLSVAGEFLVMAATLLHIKSRTLLPREEHAESGEEGEDPREELVRRLVEYQSYKEAAVALEEREAHWRDVFRREQEPLEVEPEELQLGEISLFDLLTALRGVLERAPDQSIMEITIEALTVRDRMTQILERLDRLDDEEELSFESLFDADGSRIAVIVTFLAVLELVKIQVLGLQQAEARGTIAIRRLGALDVAGDEHGMAGGGANGNG